MNGEVINAFVTDWNDLEVMVQASGITYKVNQDEWIGSPELGQAVEGFAYKNKKNEWKLTLTIPEVSKSQFAFCPVIDRRNDLGVFVDIGLKDKDVVVSLDDLPDDKKEWPNKGDFLYVCLTSDKKDRLWAKPIRLDQLRKSFRFASKMLLNQEVLATIIAIRPAGAYAYTNDRNFCFIHPNEFLGPVRLGMRQSARVIDVKADGSLNISFKPRAYEMISDDAAMILAMLQHAPHQFLPYHDKSDPDEIRHVFGISKGQFKRAIGHLYKERFISIDADGIHCLI